MDKTSLMVCFDSGLDNMKTRDEMAQIVGNAMMFQGLYFYDVIRASVFDSYGKARWTIFIDPEDPKNLVEKTNYSAWLKELGFNYIGIVNVIV